MKKLALFLAFIAISASSLNAQQQPFPKFWVSGYAQMYTSLAELAHECRADEPPGLDFADVHVMTRFRLGSRREDRLGQTIRLAQPGR